MSKRLAPPPLETMFPPASRADDPATSKQAERRMEPKRGTMAGQVLALLKAHPRGLTAKEVESYLRCRDRATGKMMEGWWKRLSDLKNAGLAVPTGETRDGGEVYVASPKGGA